MEPFVLYWMRVNRRAESNRALEFAARRANDLDLPLVCLEELDQAGDRFRTFVLEGVAETARRLAARGIGYVLGGEVERLASQAAFAVTDDHPLLETPVPFHAVDASCVVPFRAIPQRAYAAYSLRPKIRKLLPEYLKPVAPVVLRRRASAEERVPGDPPPGAGIRGGRLAAEATLREFLEHRLRRYAREKNEPSAHATSGLSPYLHFGHIGALEVALAVRAWADEHKLIADEFLEELIVRRELAFNFAHYAARHDTLDELPAWARETLRRHARDPRPALYTREQFERADTHDALWNATQKELLLRGVIHGYYRMYWGKKVIEWSASPEEALATMIYLHDSYALDGRDPNTYANILWCFGLHDRPWPERPVFGTVRYMSREGMERKTDVAAYIREIEALA